MGGILSACGPKCGRRYRVILARVQWSSSLIGCNSLGIWFAFSVWTSSYQPITQGPCKNPEFRIHCEPWVFTQNSLERMSHMMSVSCSPRKGPGQARNQSSTFTSRGNPELEMKDQTKWFKTEEPKEQSRRQERWWEQSECFYEGFTKAAAVLPNCFTNGITSGAWLGDWTTISGLWEMVDTKGRTTDTRWANSGLWERQRSVGTQVVWAPSWVLLGWCSETIYWAYSHVPRMAGSYSLICHIHSNRRERYSGSEQTACTQMLSSLLTISMTLNKLFNPYSFISSSVKRKMSWYYCIGLL